MAPGAPRLYDAAGLKTNAARLLDKLGIRYELREYDPTDEHLPAEEVAGRVGMPPDHVYKTLLVRGDRSGPVFAVIPGDAVLDLKALAVLSGNRKCETVPLKEVQPLTGYVRGGVTALAAKKDLPAFAAEAILALPSVAVSAGVRGTQIVLAPADYVRAAKAKLGPIARAKEE
jgi:Cys-tRNA(Pro)/Cys-tRNA(Cys) deacylase